MKKIKFGQVSCSECGEIIIKSLRLIAKSRTHFCSPPCCANWAVKHLTRTSTKPSQKQIMWELVCRGCGNSFHHKKPRRGRKPHFCNDCKSTNVRLGEPLQSRTVKKRFKKEERQCIACNNSFLSYVSVSRKRKYCSSVCYARDKTDKTIFSPFQYKIRKRFSNYINSTLKKYSMGHVKKEGRKWESLVGYGVQDLFAHLEKLFLPGMSWENHGLYGWHIDHKIPVSAFRFTSPEDAQFKQCWALENLQPLWATDNLRKGAKVIQPFQPLLL